MSNKAQPSRRAFLEAASCVAMAPLVAPLQVAAAPGDNRFVAILLRGGMDALEMLQPFGSREFMALRPTLRSDPGALTHLDGLYGMSEGTAELLPLWQAGELAFVQGVATPYRQGRSHFDGQDILERGGSDAGSGQGWLNRFVQTMPGMRQSYAATIGVSPDLIMQGSAPFTSWSPKTEFDLTPDELGRLGILYRGDRAFDAAFRGAIDTQGIVSQVAVDEAAGEKPDTASLAAQLLRGEARVASFSIGGWDTHRAQKVAFRRPVRAFTEAILTLRRDLGPEIWGRTLVLAMTEFGRTARENGTAGTDHGTGGLAIAAGGALRRAAILGAMPRLDEGSLYENRDLLPGEDIRRYCAWALHSLFGTDRTILESRIFPGVSMGGDPGLIG